MGEKWTEEANKYLLQRYDEGAPPRTIVQEMVAQGLRVNPDPGPLNDHIRELRGMKSRRRATVAAPVPVKKPKRRTPRKPRGKYQGLSTVTVKTTEGHTETFVVRATTLLNILTDCIRDQPDNSPWRRSVNVEPEEITLSQVAMAWERFMNEVSGSAYFPGRSRCAPIV